MYNDKKTTVPLAEARSLFVVRDRTVVEPVEAGAVVLANGTTVEREQALPGTVQDGESADQSCMT